MRMRLGLNGRRRVLAGFPLRKLHHGMERQRGVGEVHPLGAIDDGLVKQFRKPEVLVQKRCRGIQASHWYGN